MTDFAMVVLYGGFSIFLCLFFLFADTQALQWVNKYGWSVNNDGMVFVSNQEESIKTKNITEKITFDSKLSCLSSPLLILNSEAHSCVDFDLKYCIPPRKDLKKTKTTILE